MPSRTKAKAAKSRSRFEDAPEPPGVGCELTNVGSRYTADQCEFLKAVERHQKASGRKFLNHTDYLAVVLALGYSKVGRKEAKS
jgi:hypothetical protein